MMQTRSGKAFAHQPYLLKAICLPELNDDLILAPNRFRAIYKGLEWLDLSKESPEPDSNLFFDSRFSHIITLINLEPKLLQAFDVELCHTIDAREKLFYMASSCVAALIFLSKASYDGIKYVEKIRYIYQYENHFYSESRKSFIKAPVEGYFDLALTTEQNRRYRELIWEEEKHDSNHSL